MPDILYKYRSVNENNLNALLRDEIYLCSVSEFNDIQESKLNIEYEQVRNHVYSILNKPMKEKLGIDFVLTPEDCISKETIHRKIRAAISFIPKEDYDYWMACWSVIDGIFNEVIRVFAAEVGFTGNEIYRVCSFSSVQDNDLMWAHYADSHQGFCFGYNFQKLNSDLTELMLPVRYSPEILDVSEQIFTHNDKNIPINAITRKSDRWSYEQEWRLVMLASDENEKGQLLKVPAPSSVHLGARMQEVRINYQQGAMKCEVHLDAKGGMNDVSYFQNYSQLHNMDIIY